VLLLFLALSLLFLVVQALQGEAGLGCMAQVHQP
jgi:hypothetical protein